MSDMTVESLQLEVEASSSQAATSIENLATTLGKLKNATKGLGLNGVSKQLGTLNTTLNSVNTTNADNLNKLANGIRTLSSCGNLKLSSSVATQITNLGNAVRSLDNTNFTALSSLATALTPLSNMGKANLNSFISQLQRLPQAVQALNGVDVGSLSAKIRELVSALAPLSQMGKNNLTSFVTQLKKLPEAVIALQSVNISQLASQIQQLANAFAPLATQMQSIANGFSALPTRLQRLIQQTNRLSTANGRASMSYINLWAKARMAYNAIRIGANVVAGWIRESHEYIENLNLFNVSIGQYAAEAQKYAEQVAEIMGIDPSEWMRNQGVFNTIITGFGVASDKAYLMSKNLTQLGYDISSFYNISFEDAMTKLQSGISGELEPLRRLGYDLSVARLQQEALNLGITKSVSAMTQAEKSQLRYYAIMTQVTTAQGDMARTLNAPANQIRILNAQITQCARALGNIFIPALNAVLPYAIALAKVIRLLANTIASFFGFKLPEVDYSGISAGSSAVGDLADNADNATGGLDNASDAAKKLKNNLLGIDELNVLSDNPASAAGSGLGSIGVGGGDLGIELPEYDFLGDAVSTKVDEIVQKMKDWLGLTDEIDTWSEFFHTRLGRILTTVGAIGLGMAAWKISQGVLTALETIKRLQKAGLGKGITLSIGVTLAITGIALEWSGIIDAIQNELNGMNFAQILGGGGLTVAGGAMIGKALGSAILGGGIAGIVAGLPAFGVGIYDAITKGLDWLNGALIGAGATAAGAGIGAIIGACGGPIGAGIGALIGLAVGLVTDGVILVVQNWEEITSFLKKFFTVTVPKMRNKFVKWLGNIPKELGKFFKSLPGKIEGWFEDLWQPIKDYDWNGLGYNIGQWFGNAWKDAVEFVTVKVPNWFSSMWESIKTAFKTFFTQTLPTFFTQTIPNIVKSVGQFFKALPGEIYKAFVSAKQSIVDIGSAIIDGIWEGLQSIWKAITDFVDGFVQGFKDALGIASPSKVFKTIGEDIVAGLLQGIEGFTSMMNTVKQWATSVIEWFVKGKDGKNIIDHFKEIGSDIITGFKSKVSSTYSSVKSTISTWASGVRDWFTGSVNESSFVGYASNIINGFKNKISSAYTTVKSSITTWASNVKSWFSNTATSSAFAGYASDVINGFKNKIGSAYTNAKSNMQTFGSKVKSWFTDYASYNSFYNVASNVISGFKNGIGNLYSTCKNTITSWGSDIISWFKSKLGIKSPSRVFYEMAGFTIEGFNNGFEYLGKTTKGIVNSWANSFTAVTPTMAFAVDTSALSYYSTDSFDKDIAAHVSANNRYTLDNSIAKEELKEALLQALNESNMSVDMRRQADKKEQTIVQVGNRTITDAVTTQQRANGYVFAR